MEAGNSLASLKPSKRELVYDLLQQVGMDVSDWSNYAKGETAPAANPRYCYEWSFRDDQKYVVLNLWHANFKQNDQGIYCDLNMRAFAHEVARAKDEPWREKRPNPVWEKRGLNMDAAIQAAFRKRLPVRVIVCEGEMRDLAAGDERASSVKLRSLDQTPWVVQDYDWNTGQTRLVRAGALEEAVLHDEQSYVAPTPAQLPSGYLAAAARMVNTALKTVAQANGQLVESTAKLKENHFSSVEAFQSYVAELIKAQGARCALSGLPLQLDGEETDRQMLASLDRIDSAGHYAPGNLQVVCQFINRWKGADDNGDFKRLLGLLRGR